MTTIVERVNNALETLDPAMPFAMDVMIGDLPDLYIVYSLISGVPEQHADNEETARTYRVQLSIMSVDDWSTSMPDADGVMLAAGFRRGPERALPKDSESTHYGWAKDYFYQENE